MVADIGVDKSGSGDVRGGAYDRMERIFWGWLREGVRWVGGGGGVAVGGVVGVAVGGGGGGAGGVAVGVAVGVGHGDGDGVCHTSVGSGRGMYLS